MSRSYEDGYAQALCDLGNSFAELADQAQNEIKATATLARKARESDNVPAELEATKALRDNMALKIGWLKALQVTLAADAGHRAIR